MIEKKVLRLFVSLLLLVIVGASVITYAIASSDNYMELSDYRSGSEYEIPEKNGKVFAGWYWDADFTEPVSADETSGKAYAKFVAPAVFSIRNQFRAGTTTASSNTDLRIITSIDSENYTSVEFYLEAGGVKAKEPIVVHTVYTSLYNYADGDKPYTPRQAFENTDSLYFAVEKVTGIPADFFATELKITPVYYTWDGSTITGTSRTFKIKEKAELAETTVSEFILDESIAFRVDRNDTLPYSTDGTVSYKALAGGVYVNDKLNNEISLVKCEADKYMLSGVTLADDMTVVIDGIFGNDTRSIKINPAGFVYEDAQKWSEMAFVIADAKASDYVIVRGKDATASEITAATELQKYLYQISDVQIPIITDDTSATKKEIVVGKTNREIEGQFNRQELGEEGYVIQTSDTKLWIVGGEQRGTLYGVYAFLENYLGCRFYTSEVENVPSKSMLFVPEIDHKYIPVFEFRDVSQSEYLATDISVKRNMNSTLWGRNLPEQSGGGISYAGGVGGHTFSRFVNPTEYFEEHPEYFSMNASGQRVKNAQLCLTNPDVLQLIITGVRNWLAEYPDAKVVSVSQNDTQSPCLCEDCKAVYNDEGGAFSGAVLRVVNAVANDIASDYPDVKVATYAYQYTRSVPGKTKPADNVIISFCTIEGCFNHSHKENCMDNPNASYLDGHSNTITEDLAAWNAICDNLYIFDYGYNVWHSNMIFPDFDALRENILFYAQNGVTGVKIEGVSQSKTAEFGELRSYLISKLLQNPYMSETEYYKLMDDFLVGVYGPGGTYLRQYIDLAQELTASMHINLTPDPYELFPLTVVQNHATSEFPTDLTVNKVNNFMQTDWTAYWNWCTDVEENRITVEGKELFRQALAVAETEEQKERLDLLYAQIEYVMSYYYKKQIEVGQESFVEMIRAFMQAHPEHFAESNITFLIPQITNRALSQMYADYAAYNRALAEKFLSYGFSQFRPTRSLTNWKDFNYFNLPIDWMVWNQVTDLDVLNETGTHLWIATSTVDTMPYHGDWSRRYYAYGGGVYLNGTKVDVPLLKLRQNQYIVRLESYGYNTKQGTVITIEGVFGDGTNVIKFNRINCIYVGDAENGRWIQAPDSTIFDSTIKGTELYFETDSADMLPYEEGDALVYAPMYGGVYVNGKLKANIGLTKYGQGKYKIVWSDYDIVPNAKTRIVIDGIFGNGTEAVAFCSETFVYDGDGKWHLCYEPDVTGVAGSTLWIKTGASDTLEANTNWTCRYYAKTGGIYLNGVRVEQPMRKIYSDTYVVYSGVANHGDILTINGTFGDDTNDFQIGPVTFVFDANIGASGAWIRVEESKLEDGQNQTKEEEGYDWEDLW